MIQKHKFVDNFFISSRDLSNTMGPFFERLQEYGCWCFFEEKYGLGKSHPLDDYDAACQQLSYGYECAISDEKTHATNPGQ